MNLPSIKEKEIQVETAKPKQFSMKAYIKKRYRRWLMNLFIWYPLKVIERIIYTILQSRIGQIAIGMMLMRLITPWIMKFFGDTMPAWLKYWLWPFMLLPFCIVISGCSSTQQKPADIGTGTDDLKQSVCASCNGKPFYQNGQWLINH